MAACLATRRIDCKGTRRDRHESFGLWSAVGHAPFDVWGASVASLRPAGPGASMLRKRCGAPGLEKGGTTEDGAAQSAAVMAGLARHPAFGCIPGSPSRWGSGASSSQELEYGRMPGGVGRDAGSLDSPKRHPFSGVGCRHIYATPDAAPGRK